MQIIIPDNVIACLFSLKKKKTNLKSTCIKQYVYNYTVELKTHTNLTYLTKTSQRWWVGKRFYLRKEVTPDGSLNLQEKN